MCQRGIRQWNPGEVTSADVRKQADNGEWHIVNEAGALAGAVRLVWEDPAIWDDLVDERHSDAGYVHGLMVSPQHRGRGLGVALLGWAERQMIARGVRTSRLDCVASNAALRAYYRGLGYRELSVREFENGWYPLMRFERALSGSTVTGRDHPGAGVAPDVAVGDVRGERYA